MPFDQLVDAVQGEGQPREVLVWRKGFADWARAADVPELERRLARPAAEEAAPPAPLPVPLPARPPIPVEATKPSGGTALPYGGTFGGVALVGLLAWLLWPRAEAPVTPSPSPPARPTARPRAPAGVPEGITPNESELPAANLKHLRGVARWSGDTLTLTVYNGTPWRITELHVRISRFSEGEFVEDLRTVALFPPGAAPLSPAASGPFVGEPGLPPASFRWAIEAARGYAPR